MLNTINKKDQHTATGVYIVSLLTLIFYLWGTYFYSPPISKPDDTEIMIFFAIKISFILFVFSSIVGSVFVIMCQSSVTDTIKTLLHINSGLALILLII